MERCTHVHSHDMHWEMIMELCFITVRVHAGGNQSVMLICIEGKLDGIIIHRRSQWWTKPFWMESSVWLSMCMPWKPQSHNVWLLNMILQNLCIRSGKQQPSRCIFPNGRQCKQCWPRRVSIDDRIYAYIYGSRAYRLSMLNRWIDGASFSSLTTDDAKFAVGSSGGVERGALDWLSIVY